MLNEYLLKYLNTTVIMLVLVLHVTVEVSGQISESQIQSAALNNNCLSIDKELLNAELTGEKMQYYGAICLYKNDKIEKAHLVFSKLDSIGNSRKNNVRYWIAKCLAKEKKNDLALTQLVELTPKNLNAKMLSIPEFDELRSYSEFEDIWNQVKPGFNGWTIGLVFITILGFVIGLVLLFDNRYSQGSIWMAFCMLGFSISLTSFILIWTKYAQYYPYINNVWNSLALITGPTIYFYLRTVFQDTLTRKLILGHFTIPIISFLLTSSLILVNLGIIIKPIPNLFAIGGSTFIIVAHLTYYGVLIRNYIDNDWSIDSNILQWAKTIVKGYWLYTIAFISYFVLSPTSFFDPAWDYMISFTMSIGILVVAYMVFLQKRVWKSEPISNYLPVSKYETSPLTPSSSRSIVKKLVRLLEEDYVFKENELRLDDLASYLDISRHQLSQVINQQYGVNFFEFINNHRIQHVDKLLKSEKFDHYTLQQIAFEAGFNNKSSFNRYFKKVFGITPSAYRIKLKAETKE